MEVSQRLELPVPVVGMSFYPARMRRLLVLTLLLGACTASTDASDPTTTTTTAPTATTATSATSSTSPQTSTSGSLPTTTSPTSTTTTQPTTIPPTTTTLAPTTTTPAPTTTQPPAFRLAYQNVANMNFPIAMAARPGTSTSYVATKAGRVYLYDGTSISSSTVLDISGRVRNSGEQGFLGMALHPSNQSRFFAHYTATNGATVISEFTFSSPTSINAGSERVIFRHDQPAANHNGGSIQFGPGGLLYASLGDGGGSNDQYDHGQNSESLLGGIVSMSVDGSPNPTLYSMGLRNPWRTFIDGTTMYVPDVGQGRFEEVNVVSMQANLNFGWPIMEGASCHQPSSGCNTAGLVQPVVVVSHGDQGTCSITGGVVYKGSALPEISGHYFYSDWCGGYLRSFRWTGSVGSVSTWTSQVGRLSNVASFGLDGAGEMYVLTNSTLLKVVRGS